MCLGPSEGLTNTGQEQQQAYQQAMSQASQIFGNDSQVFHDIVGAFGPQVAAGPQIDQVALNQANAAAVTNNAQAYASAAKNVKESIAAQGGGNVLLPSGVTNTTLAELSEAGAQNLAGTEAQNTQTAIQQGIQNYQFAANQLAGAPNTFGTANTGTSAATGAGAASSTTQNDITNAQNSWESLAAAGLGAGATIASAGLKPPACWLAAAAFDEDFITGAKTGLVRSYLWVVWAKNWYAKPILTLYHRFGQRLAQNNTIVRLFRPVFYRLYERLQCQ
jgi:hypothetical protein